MQLRSPWAVPGRNRQLKTHRLLWLNEFHTACMRYMCRSAQTASFLRSLHAWPNQLLSRICSRLAPGWNTAAVESRMDVLRCFQHGLRPRCSSHSHHYDAVLHCGTCRIKNLDDIKEAHRRHDVLTVRNCMVSHMKRTGLVPSFEILRKHFETTRTACRPWWPRSVIKCCDRQTP